MHSEHLSLFFVKGDTLPSIFFFKKRKMAFLFFQENKKEGQLITKKDDMTFYRRKTDGNGI